MSKEIRDISDGMIKNENKLNSNFKKMKWLH